MSNASEPEDLCTLSTMLHVTREDGEVVRVGRELVIRGPMTIHMNGRLVGTTRELRAEVPLYEKPANGGPTP